MSTTWHYESEMSVLGSMVLDFDAACSVSELLKVDDFFRPAHRILFRLFVDLIERGRPIDLVVVEEALTRTNQVQEIGSMDYLLEIAEYVPSSANALYYAGIVQEYATRRRMQGAANRILKMVDDSALPEEFSDYLGAISGKVGAVGAFPVVALADIRYDAEAVRAISSGWQSLDDASGVGGFPRKQVSMISADTGRGKSTFMQCVAMNAAKENKRVLYVVWADLDRNDFRSRAIKMLTGWHKRPYDLQKAADYDQEVADMDMGAYPIDFLDVVEERMPELETFFAHLAQEHRRKRYDLVCMDYAQSFELAKRTQSEVDKQTQCARLCALKAKQIDVPLVIGSQVGEDGKTAYSREWERVCAMNLMIQDDGVLVKKSRHFGQARGAVLPIQFNKGFSTFEDRS